MTASPFVALLSDLDGTLVETERVLYAAWVELGRRAGVDFRTMDYAKIIGRPDLDCCAIVAAHFGLARDPAAWYQEYRVIALGMMDKDLDLRPGVHAFLATADAACLPVALVTSATTEHARKALDKYGLFGRFRAHVTADTPGLKARKPDPSPYLLAAALLGVDPRRCAAFEDSPAGVASALAAGCRVYAIPHEHSPASGLMKAHVLLGSIDWFNPNDPLYP